MLPEAKSNGHATPVTRAWETRFAKIEQRIVASEESHEQRILILRDAMAVFAADFVSGKLAPLHDEIAALKKSNAELQRQLQQKSDVDKQIEEVIKRLDARQIARDQAKRGPKSERGERGSRGERGLTGARGPTGKRNLGSFLAYRQVSRHVDSHKRFFATNPRFEAMFPNLRRRDQMR